MVLICSIRFYTDKRCDVSAQWVAVTFRMLFVSTTLPCLLNLKVDLYNFSIFNVIVLMFWFPK